MIMVIHAEVSFYIEVIDLGTAVLVLTLAMRFWAMLVNFSCIRSVEASSTAAAADGRRISTYTKADDNQSPPVSLLCSSIISKTKRNLGEWTSIILRT